MNRALIIFAKAPVPGRVKTRLCPPLSHEQAAGLYGCMLQDSLAKAARLAGSMTLFLFYEPAGSALRAEELAEGMVVLPQEGADLGERMAGALAKVFSTGYKAAAIIGTDSPHLPSGWIMDAFARLQDADAVFGPAADGGYYLAGMKRNHPELFRGIDWGSSTVLRETLRQAAVHGLAVSLLPEWHDVDTPDDLSRPELLDERNGAELTRRFILKLRANAVPPVTTP